MASQRLGLVGHGVDPQREEGAFLSPGLWVDRWEVLLPADEGGPQVFRFTHAVTPVDDRHARHHWRVSRNFAPGGEASEALRPIFEAYYLKVRESLETMSRSSTATATARTSTSPRT